MRKFKLKNALGQEFDLMRLDALLYEPEGMGTEREFTYLNLGGRWKKTNESIVQPSIHYMIRLEGYKVYGEFMRFVSAGGLILSYRPLDVWWDIECDLGSIGKSELPLFVPVHVSGASLWYRRHDAVKSVFEGEGTQTKQYPYRYPYRYTSRSTSVLNLLYEGYMPGYSKITIYGPAMTPQWGVALNGETLATGRAKTTLSSLEKLVVDSDPASLKVAVYNTSTGAFIRDVEPDFSTQMFVYPEAGANVFTFTHSGRSAMRAEVEVTELAETV